jgi:hypothetical protein
MMLLVMIDILNQAFKIISNLNFDNGVAPTIIGYQFKAGHSLNYLLLDRVLLSADKGRKAKD